MNAVYQAVLFDMDGVVIDSEQQVRSFWQKLADRYNVILTEDDFIERIFGRKAHDTLEALFTHVSEADMQATFADLRDGETDAVYTPISGVLEAIQNLKQLGIPIALVTSASDWKIDAVLSQLALKDAFKTIVSAHDITAGKPDPACYLKAAEKLGFAPETCIVLEDAVSGVQAAINAGMVCIGVGKYREQLLTAGASTVIDDFTHLIVSAANHAEYRFEIRTQIDTRFVLALG